VFAFLVVFSLRHRLVVLAAAALLVLYGGFAARQLPLDVVPDLTKPLVILVTEAGGMAPEEVEVTVSFPIETAMNGMPGVTRVRSVSGPGLSVAFIEFDWGTDIFRNRQLVAERVALARDRLPPNVNPTMGPISSIMGDMMIIALPTSGVDPMVARELADWVIRPRLLAIPGVSQVLVLGGEIRQYVVTPNLAAMRALGITLRQLEEALARFSVDTGGGFVDQAGRELVVRNLGRSVQLDDLRNLAVASKHGQTIILDMVARADFGPRFRRGDAGLRGGPAVILTIQKQPATNTLDLTASLHAAMAELTPTLPQALRAYELPYQQASLIEASIHNVYRVLIEAMIVVTIVLFLFLMNARTTLISLAAIPISVCLTLIVFRQFGLTINTMTLGGLAIAIGELVDDAVVGVENVLRRLRENPERADPIAAARIVADASMEVRSGIVYATMVILFVFVPLFALPGIEGRLFTPLGIAYIVSILASLIVSVTVTPAMCYWLLPRMRDIARTESALVRFLKRVNERAVRKALGNPKPLIVGTAVAVGVAVWSVPFLPRTFLPQFIEGAFLVVVQAEPGISLSESNRIGALAERLVELVPEVRLAARRTGRAELDEHAKEIFISELDVLLHPSERKLSDIMADIRARLAMLPASIAIGQPIGHRIEEVMSGVRAQIALKIFGDDLETLRRLAGQVHDGMRRIDGLMDVNIEPQVDIPQLRIRVDYDRARLLGVTPTRIVEAIGTLSDGHVVSQVVDGARRYDLLLRLASHERSAAGIAELQVETPTGRIPLSRIATVETEQGPNQIYRENARRRILVYANTDGTNNAGAIAEIRKLLAGVEMPAGYFANMEGTFQAQEESQLLIGLLSLVSLSLIFVVLYTRYRSAVLTLIIMGNVPLALIGGVAALWIFGQALSVSSMIGFITLAGISTRNGILKISHFINLMLREREPFGEAMIVRGCLERLTPVLMTALSAGLALIPLLHGAETPGKEVLHPVAVVIFGGLISATLLDALLTPVLFHRFGKAAVERINAMPADRERPAEAF
jgi:HME family heavy-metal exporter